MVPAKHSRKGFWLDPRTKLYLLVMFSIVMLNAKNDTFGLWFKPMLAFLPFVLLLSCGSTKAAWGYVTAYYICWVSDLYLLNLFPPALKIIFSLLTQMATRWMPGAMMGYYFFVSTKINEFTLAMYCMHIPDAFVVPFSVMFRFFPTVHEEMQAIRNAMKMRGIGKERFFKNPQAAIEYRLVPLMVSVTTIGNELSAAAITRGLGSKHHRTSIGSIGFHIADWFLIVLVTGVLLAYALRTGGLL